MMAGQPGGAGVCAGTESQAASVAKIAARTLNFSENRNIMACTGAGSCVQRCHVPSGHRQSLAMSRRLYVRLGIGLGEACRLKATSLAPDQVCLGTSRCQRKCVRSPKVSRPTASDEAPGWTTLDENHTAIDHHGLACHIVRVRGREEEGRADHVFRHAFAADQVRSGERFKCLTRTG